VVTDRSVVAKGTSNWKVFHGGGANQTTYAISFGAVVPTTLFRNAPKIHKDRLALSDHLTTRLCSDFLVRDALSAAEFNWLVGKRNRVGTAAAEVWM